MAAPSSYSAAPMSVTLPRSEMSSLVRQVTSPSLYNRQLSSVCQVNGLKSTGVKAELQRRITDLIQEAYNANDVSRFYLIKQSIINAMTKRPSPQKPAPGRIGATPSVLPSPAFDGQVGNNGYGQTQSFNGYGVYGQSHRDGSSFPSSASSTLNFKPSPFYNIDSQIGAVHPCPAMAQHRSSVHIVLRLNETPALQRCVENSSYRVMIFCAADGSGPQDIIFPHQSELKINGGDFKANLRGLKNKPGSTRPVDITSALRLRPSYTNNVEFTYALTSKKFNLAVFVCRVKTPAELVMDISTRRKIPMNSVIAELNKKAQDPDVVATSQILSLKCPLSYMRLDVPCRSINCTHIQCFDATSYLQLQEQGPQWLCPICSKPAQFEHLAVDEYVRDILEKTPKSLETVTIEPDGRWLTKATGQDRPRSSQAASFADDEDDDIEVSEVTMIGGKRVDMSKPSTPNVNTPTTGSRGGSSTRPLGLGSTSGKRPAAAVIDLTLSSDDDDDEPIQRPTKRQNTGMSNGNGNFATNAYHETDSLGFLSESPLDYPH